jgi:hypothetical protein
MVLREIMVITQTFDREQRAVIVGNINFSATCISSNNLCCRLCHFHEKYYVKIFLKPVFCYFFNVGCYYLIPNRRKGSDSQMINLLVYFL